jgi:hypothetical protein
MPVSTARVVGLLIAAQAKLYDNCRSVIANMWPLKG